MADEKKIEDEECLPKGTIVRVRCADGREKHGEVVAFDPQNQILILRKFILDSDSDLDHINRH